MDDVYFMLIDDAGYQPGHAHIELPAPDYGVKGNCAFVHSIAQSGTGIKTQQMLAAPAGRKPIDQIESLNLRTTTHQGRKDEEQIGYSIDVGMTRINA